MHMDRRLLAALVGVSDRLSTEADISDAELLGRFAHTRDGAAFAELVRRHGPLVWNICRRQLPNPSDAEDAFQATFLALVQGSHNVRGAVPGWLYGVAVRVCTRVKRGAVRGRQREAQVARSEADAPVPDSAWATADAALQAAVAALPVHLQTAFVVCDLGGVPQPEAARQLGWKPGTLSGRLTKARQTLLARLTRQGLAPAVATATIASAAAHPPSLVPLRLADAVGLLTTTAPGAVPVLISHLATQGMIMGISRMKLMALGVLAAGGLTAGVGPVVGPLAFGQGASGGPGRPGVAKSPEPPASPANFQQQQLQAARAQAAGVLESVQAEVARAAALQALAAQAYAEAIGAGGQPFSGTKIEHDLVAEPKTLDGFKKLLAEKGQSGWEYAGPAPVFGKDQAPTLIFKRAAVYGTAGVSGPIVPQHGTEFRFGTTNPSAWGSVDVFGVVNAGELKPLLDRLEKLSSDAPNHRAEIIKLIDELRERLAKSNKQYLPPTPPAPPGLGVGPTLIPPVLPAASPAPAVPPAHIPAPGSASPSVSLPALPGAPATPKPAANAGEPTVFELKHIKASEAKELVMTLLSIGEEFPNGYQVKAVSHSNQIVVFGRPRRRCNGWQTCSNRSTNPPSIRPCPASRRSLACWHPDCRHHEQNHAHADSPAGGNHHSHPVRQRARVTLRVQAVTIIGTAIRLERGRMPR